MTVRENHLYMVEIRKSGRFERKTEPKRYDEINCNAMLQVHASEKTTTATAMAPATKTSSKGIKSH